MFAAPTPIDIGGTFKKPSFGLDTKVLVERGAATVALGVVLTPVGSLLAFIDPGTAKDSGLWQGAGDSEERAGGASRSEGASWQGRADPVRRLIVAAVAAWLCAGPLAGFAQTQPAPGANPGEAEIEAVLVGAGIS